MTQGRSLFFVVERGFDGTMKLPFPGREGKSKVGDAEWRPEREEDYISHHHRGGGGGSVVPDLPL